MYNPENMFKPKAENVVPGPVTPEKTEMRITRGTPEKLQNGAEKVIDIFCKNFRIEGEENLCEISAAAEKNEKFVITSSHLSNMDGPAAIKTFGKRLNLQLGVDSRHFDWPAQRFMYQHAGKENFSPLEYRVKKGDQPVFNPKNFTDLEQKMEEGKTPWLAVHSWSPKQKMLEPRIGAVYLAQKTGAKIIPTALELSGTNITLNSPLELLKGVIKKANAVYHIGKPIGLEPVNVGIIENVLSKRKNKEKITDEERNEFHLVHEKLKEQAIEIAKIISEMLPKEFRGNYENEN